MTIIWTQRALKSYFKVADYLQEELGERVVNDFTTEVQKVIEQIDKMPNMFEVSKKYKNVIKGFVTEQNTLYYRIKPRKKEIELLIFWDNRQDPKKLKY
ncbi:MAG: type II toxin-antitoxin system RelE/ParE family toxin [Bacteroidales bacterium]|nr:type II toxin-antitoxin system RelE/ParE family toxin [Bacteroidales bacterium]